MPCPFMNCIVNPQVSVHVVKLKPQRGKYNGVIEIICIFQLYRSVAFLNATPQALSLKSNHN